MMKLKMQATKDASESAMALKREEQKLAMEHDKIISEIHLSRKKRLAEIESSKMERIIECLGKDTLVAMARVSQFFLLLVWKRLPDQDA
jgi:major vault protein